MEEKKASSARPVPVASGSGSRAEAPSRPLLVFVHVPKTGGTTFIQILRDNFLPGTVRETGNVFRGAEGGFSPAKAARFRDVAPLLAHGADALHGHIPFGLCGGLPTSARYVTFVRHPIERTLSHYESLREFGRIYSDVSLADAFAEGLLLDNVQTRILCSHEEPSGKATRQMLAEAKKNLSKRFLAFGLTERFEESLVLMRRRIPLASILHTRLRVTDRTPGDAPPELVSVAEEANRLDLELYQWAVNQFETAVASEGPVFSVELAALRRAQTGEPHNAAVDGVIPPTVNRKTLWHLAVSTQAELLLQGYELGQTRAASRDQQLATLLTQTVGSLERMAEKIKHQRDTAAEHKLEAVLAEIAELESFGNGAPDARTELARLHEVADRLRRRMESTPDDQPA